MMSRVCPTRSLAGWVIVIALVWPLSAAAIPRVDHEANCTYKQLSWDDFRGPTVNGQQAAWILSTVILESFESQFETTEDVVVATAKYPAVYAYMDKLGSGVRTGARNEYTLAHEQVHFDITELHARQFAEQMKTIRGVGPDRRSATQDLYAQVEVAYEELMRRLGTMQRAYDGETTNGLRKKDQKRWAAKVEALLAEADAYPIL